MLTNGNISSTQFSGSGVNAFRALASAVHAADVRRAQGLKSTQAARAANRARRAGR